MATMLRPTSDVILQMRHEKAKLLRQPELTVMPVELNRDEEFIFRTKPGTVRGLQHTIDTAPQDKSEARQEFYRKRYEKRVPPAQRKIEAEIYELVGGSKIVFTRIPNAHECFYATNDPTVAAYIRGLMLEQRGDFRFVYEENSRSVIQVGAEVFPNTLQGRRAAMDYADEHNIKTIEFDPAPEPAEAVTA